MKPASFSNEKIQKSHEKPSQPYPSLCMVLTNYIRPISTEMHSKLKRQKEGEHTVQTAAQLEVLLHCSSELNVKALTETVNLRSSEWIDF